jgi:hypothetical protein
MAFAAAITEGQWLGEMELRSFIMRACSGRFRPIALAKAVALGQRPMMALCERTAGFTGEGALIGRTDTRASALCQYPCIGGNG